jgi:hypothetical protein
VTNAGGIARLTLRPSATGRLTLTITAPGVATRRYWLGVTGR